MIDTPVLLTAAKSGFVLIVLALASLSDIRSRRVKDSYWMVLLGIGSVFVLLEMLEQGAGDRIATLFSLSLPAIGLVFVVWGYPEFGKVIKGERTDLLFAGIYSLLIAGSIASFVFGDRVIAGKVLVSFIFMALYFAMYSFSLFGTRLLHGGADAKCMMSLAALFPWYGGILPVSFGPFYEMLDAVPALEYISPVHLGTLVNGAFVTVAFIIVYIPLRNIISGTFHPLKSWTTYEMDAGKVEGRHVWIVMEGSGNDRKQDPTPELIKGLMRKGVKKVRVTPKVPFISSLTLGLAIQMVLGNLVFALMFAF